MLTDTRQIEQKTQMGISVAQAAVNYFQTSLPWRGEQTYFLLYFYTIRDPEFSEWPNPAHLYERCTELTKRGIPTLQVAPQTGSNNQT